MGAEAFRVGGDGGDGFCAGFHEDAEHPPAVVKGDGGNRWWQGEDDVEIRGRQDAGQLSAEPVAGGAALTGWAVPVAAGVVKHMVRIAVPADEKPGPQCRGAAHSDGRERFQRHRTEPGAESLKKLIPAMAEDIRHGGVFKAQRSVRQVLCRVIEFLEHCRGGAGIHPGAPG